LMLGTPAHASGAERGRAEIQRCSWRSRRCSCDRGRRSLRVSRQSVHAWLRLCREEGPIGFAGPLSSGPRASGGRSGPTGMSSRAEMRCLLASAAGHEMAAGRGGKGASIYTLVALTACAPPPVVRSVGSNVIVNAGDRGNGNRLHVDTGRVDGRYGHCRASQDRSGRAECYDSGND